MMRLSMLVFLAMAMGACSSGANGILHLGDAATHADTPAVDVGMDGTATDAVVDAGATMADAMDGTSPVDVMIAPWDAITNEAGTTSFPDGSVTLPDGAVMLPDGAVVAGSPDGCGPTEICNNGLDDNCNGDVDENCPCLPGMVERCYDGSPAEAGHGVCVWGSQTCGGSGEFGAWMTCIGAGHPETVVCGERMDFRCDGIVDEGCACTLGATRTCYDGPMGTQGVGACTAGVETCAETDGGVGGSSWGACTGEVTPTVDTCDGIDHSCSGAASPCLCVGGATQPCYTGPTGTEGVGACMGGTQTCVVSAGASSWGACMGEVTPVADTCDGIDHSCSGPASPCLCVGGATQPCYDGPPGTEGAGPCHGGTQTCVVTGSASAWGACAGEVTTSCVVCFSAGLSPWQELEPPGPICFGETFSTHGAPGEYAFATIPSATDPGWSPVTAGTIAFSAASNLCGTACSCLNGGQFTFFQTFFTIPVGFTVSSFVVNIGSVDDGVRITVFNTANPGGVVDPGSYVYLGSGGATTDLAPYLVAGSNRIVLTHIDDCCASRSLEGVTITINGGALPTCM